VTNAPPPALYLGRTVHVRFQPFERRFSYGVFQLFLDVDRIGESARQCPLLAYNRAGLVSFHDRDHGDRSGRPLRAWAEAAFSAHGIAIEGGALRLLAFPRLFGYVFNPLSVFFGYGPDGGLRGLLFEVNNTFGETHTYVAPYLPGDDLVAPKRFHVSPFLDVTGDYRFRIAPPGERLSLTIDNLISGTRSHLATLNGKRAPLSSPELLGAMLRAPLMTLKVISAIHWEALQLWRRGAGYRAKPAAPAQPFTAARPLEKTASEPAARRLNSVS
jgi:hypothetical protein